MLLSGKVYFWEPYGHTRRYALLSMPYRDLLEIAQVYRYDALTNKGEQRDEVPSHVRKLLGEAKEGNLTPAAFALGLHPNHQKHVKYDEGNFTLEVSDKSLLAITDGQQRLAAFAKGVKELEDRMARGEDLRVEKERLLNLSLPIILYLDGDTQKDFANLQAGRPVDKAHMLSLRIQKMLKDPVLTLAFECARHLDTMKKSPFAGMIRFDSHGGEMASLPLTTLCSRSPADLSTSLVGLAKVGHGWDVKSADVLAASVCDTYVALTKQVPELLETGKVLTPPNKKGTKGAATMLVGVATQVYYRLASTDKKKMDFELLGKLTDAARATLDVAVEGAFAAPLKRDLMGKFARRFLGDLPEEMVDSVPKGLIDYLSASALGVAKVEPE